MTLEATVRADGAGVPTGTVTFRDGATPLSTVPLGPDGVARLDARFGWGTHTISALYDGDAAFAPSLATTTQVVQARTLTALAAVPARSTFGQPVDLVATVRSDAPGAITGDVTFADGERTLGDTPLDGSGEARLPLSSLHAGDHTLTAYFRGDPRFSDSSAQTVHHVEKAATSAHLSVTVDSSTRRDDPAERLPRPESQR